MYTAPASIYHTHLQGYIINLKHTQTTLCILKLLLSCCISHSHTHTHTQRLKSHAISHINHYLYEIHNVNYITVATEITTLAICMYITANTASYYLKYSAYVVLAKMWPPTKYVFTWDTLSLSHTHTHTTHHIHWSFQTYMHWTYHHRDLTMTHTLTATP